jgi:hypothetical protein
MIKKIARALRPKSHEFPVTREYIAEFGCGNITGRILELREGIFVSHWLDVDWTGPDHKVYRYGALRCSHMNQVLEVMRQATYFMEKRHPEVTKAPNTALPIIGY